ncbi:MAG: transcriptional regulator [Hyphomicrobiales bacterium]|nr:transcriptional regulator [Hyphomicrobiales bacterium]
MLDATSKGIANEAPFGGMDDVYSKPGHLIRRLQQIAVSVFTRECADHDMTPVQYAALVAVRDNPELDATRIAALIAFDRSTLGNVLERLEAKGLIERRAKTDDRRVKILRLSRRGSQLLEVAEPAVLRAQSRMLDPLDEAERNQFLLLVRRIIARQDGPPRGENHGPS